MHLHAKFQFRSFTCFGGMFEGVLNQLHGQLRAETEIHWDYFTYSGNWDWESLRLFHLQWELRLRFTETISLTVGIETEIHWDYFTYSGNWDWDSLRLCHLQWELRLRFTETISLTVGTATSAACRRDRVSSALNCCSRQLPASRRNVWRSSNSNSLHSMYHTQYTMTHTQYLVHSHYTAIQSS